jgi:hypothetical protein
MAVSGRFIAQEKSLPRREWVEQLIERKNVLVGYYDRDNLSKYVAGILLRRRQIAELTAKQRP